MKLKTFFTDDDAVSPVIGVILMVAITVILAAVIASFVLGLGDTTQTTPSASLDFDYDRSTGEVTINHQSGDTLDESKVTVKVDGSAASAWDSSGEITAGSSTTVAAASGQSVSVVWESSSGDSSSTLGSFDVPNTAPSATINFNDGGSPLVIEHDGGDTLYGSNLAIDAPDSASLDTEPTDGSTYTSGDTVGEVSGLTSDDTVKLVWSSGDSSKTLDEYTVP